MPDTPPPTPRRGRELQAVAWSCLAVIAAFWWSLWAVAGWFGVLVGVGIGAATLVWAAVDVARDEYRPPTEELLP